MSDILRSAVRAHITEWPLAWRGKSADLWETAVGDLSSVVFRSSATAWNWTLFRGHERVVVNEGIRASRSQAMEAAEAAARAASDPLTDVQILTGWVALQADAPDDVIAAAFRLAYQDKANRKASK